MIRPFVKNTRIEQLKCMHEMMIHSNNEGIYEAWIEYMPDEPKQNDFEFIAENEEFFEEIFKVFLKLISVKSYRI